MPKALLSPRTLSVTAPHLSVGGQERGQQSALATISFSAAMLAAVGFTSNVPVTEPSGGELLRGVTLALPSPTTSSQNLRTILQPSRVIDLTDYEEALALEPVLDGMTHPGSMILEGIFLRAPVEGSAAVMAIVAQNATAPARAADTLRLVGRMANLDSAWRKKIIIAALASTVIEVRDAAIQALESWADPVFAPLLQAHNEVDPFLQDYASRVLSDLGV